MRKKWYRELRATQDKKRENIKDQLKYNHYSEQIILKLNYLLLYF